MFKLATLESCASVAGLSPAEMLVGVSPGEKHRRMVARYRGLSPAFARSRLVAAIRAAQASGANARAADLMIVLRLLLSAPTLITRTAFRRRSLRIRESRFVCVSDRFNMRENPERDFVVTGLFEARPTAK